MLQQVVKFQVTTWNINYIVGLTAVTEDMQHLLQQSWEAKKVRVHVFTETKLVSRAASQEMATHIFHAWDVH